MLVSTVFACLSKIGGAVLQLPLHQYRMTNGGNREAVLPKSRLWWMLNERPSATWTAASWKEWIVRCVHLRGDQHTEIMRTPGEKNGGEIIGLYPHHPDCVVTRRYVNEFGEIRLAYDVQNPLTKTSYTLDQDDMLHFSGFGFDGLRSVSVIQQAARAAIGVVTANTTRCGRHASSSTGSKLGVACSETRQTWVWKRLMS